MPQTPQTIDAALADKIRSSAAAREQDRELQPDIAQQLARAGMFNMLLPTTYGGREVDPHLFIDTLISGAKADGAVGWCMMIGNTTSLLSASLSDHWAQEIYGVNPEVITCGVTAPYGRVNREGDDLRVSGRWPYGSGGNVSEWISGGCLLKDGDNPPQQILAFFHKNDVIRHDNWNTSGLRGTGSNDFEVDNVLVPKGRWIVLGGRPRIDAPLYRFPTLGLLALGVASVSVGIAQRAIEAFTELANAKTPTGSKRSLATRESVQKDLARAMACESSARAYMHAATEDAWIPAQKGERISRAHKAGLRLAASNAAWQSAEAVDLLYHAAGGSSIYAENVLQRCFRDVHVTTQHIMVAQPTYEMLGKIPLGLDEKVML